MTDLGYKTDLEQEQQNKMSLVNHLDELRTRLIRICISIGIFTVLSYIYSEQILWFLKKPYPYTLVFLTPLEPLNVMLEISIFGGILFSLPVIFHQLWQFVEPGLQPKEKKYFIIYLPAAVILFLAGAAFCYYFFLPASLKFLLGFAGTITQPMVSISSYISFVVMMSLVFGLTFELPLILLLLSKLGVVSYRSLARNRGIALVLSFIIGAVITPTPDLFGQVCVAVPLIILYEVSIWLIRIIK
jgi:sec-independent protein translocase protein TatC